MTSPITCIVTLHGIGFEQPPQGNIPGYADSLHEHLSIYLDGLLSDDPNRQRNQKGEHGPIYVQSRYLTADGQASREEGLKRLGSWSGDMRSIVTQNAPLVANDERIAHVALVYSNLEPQGPALGAAAIATAMSLFSASHYAHITGLLHMVWLDTLAMVEHPTLANAQSPGLHPRNDLRRSKKPIAQDTSPTLLMALRNLEDDVACYVCHNEERERVRSFVNEALLRLAYRDDVGEIILNTHSNGTVIALDVLRQLPPFVAAKVKVFITAGSPLRKYIDLFRWGQQIESLNPIKPWHNFWDECDPVADPLEPPISWHRGDMLQSPYDTKLFLLIDPNSGRQADIEVIDHKIDNVHNSSGGGMQAHNYWDNDEFVSQFVEIVRSAIDQPIATAA